MEHDVGGLYEEVRNGMRISLAAVASATAAVSWESAGMFQKFLD